MSIDFHRHDVLEQLRPGQVLEAWRGGQLTHRGVAEEIMPELGVLWVRESVLGIRQLIDLQEYELRPV